MNRSKYSLAAIFLTLILLLSACISQPTDSKIQNSTITSETVEFNPAHWSEIPVSFPEYSYVYDITTTPDGSVWFASSYGVLRYDGSAWNIESPSPETKFCTSIASNSKTGLLVVACLGGFYRWTGESWVQFGAEPPKILKQTMFIGLQIQDNGDLWTGIVNPEMGYLPGLGLVHFDGQQWHIYYPDVMDLDDIKTEKTDIPFHDVINIQAGLDGRLWFETNVGISSYNGRTWSHYVFSNVTGQSFTQDENATHKKSGLQGLVVSTDGTIWVGSLLGVSQFDGSTWTLYTTPSTSEGVAAIEPYAAGSDGSVWFTQPGYLLRFDGSTWWNYPLPSDFQNPLIAAVGTDHALWMANYEDMIVRFFPGEEPAPTVMPLPTFKSIATTSP